MRHNKRHGLGFSAAASFMPEKLTIEKGVQVFSSGDAPAADPGLGVPSGGPAASFSAVGLPENMVAGEPPPALEGAPTAVQVAIEICALHDEAAAATAEIRSLDDAWKVQEMIHTAYQSWLPGAQKNLSIAKAKVSQAKGEAIASGNSPKDVACGDILKYGKEDAYYADGDGCWSLAPERWDALYKQYKATATLPENYPIKPWDKYFPGLFFNGQTLSTEDQTSVLFVDLYLLPSINKRVSAKTLGGPIAQWIYAWMQAAEIEFSHEPIVPGALASKNISAAHDENITYAQRKGEYLDAKAALEAHIQDCQDLVAFKSAWLQKNPVDEKDAAAAAALAKAGCALSTQKYLVLLLQDLAALLLLLTEQMEDLKRDFDDAVASGNYVLAMELAAKILILAGKIKDADDKFKAAQEKLSAINVVIATAAGEGLYSPQQIQSANDNKADAKSAAEDVKAAIETVINIILDVGETLADFPPGVTKDPYYGGKWKDLVDDFNDTAATFCESHPEVAACGGGKKKSSGIPWWVWLIGAYGVSKVAG